LAQTSIGNAVMWYFSRARHSGRYAFTRGVSNRCSQLCREKYTSYFLSTK